MAEFHLDGQRLAYTVYGEGSRTAVLLPGLLLSQKMQAPLARRLAARGNQVITLDPLGHGASSRPCDQWRYSISAFAQQTVALLDHLGIDRAVVGGTSLGANITLEVALQAPDRMAGMVLEMPVLDHAIAACGAAFIPLLFALRFGEPGMRALARGARAVPRGPLPLLAQLGLDWLSQDPGPSAAVLNGILYGRAAPGPSRTLPLRDPRAGDRPPSGSGAPLLRRRHARLRTPQRPAGQRPLGPRASRQSGAADQQDRGVRGPMLGLRRRSLGVGRRGGLNHRRAHGRPEPGAF